VILLDPVVLVIDMQRWNHPVRNDARAEAAGRGLIHAAIKDQLHLKGSGQSCNTRSQVGQYDG
jgi:hypothetical protein